MVQLHGNQPSDVKSVWPHWDHKTYTVEDMAVGQVRFDTGCMMTIESSFVSHIEKDIFNIQIMGERGGAVWDPPRYPKAGVAFRGDDIEITVRVGPFRLA